MWILLLCCLSTDRLQLLWQLKFLLKVNRCAGHGLAPLGSVEALEEASATPVASGELHRLCTPGKLLCAAPCSSMKETETMMCEMLNWGSSAGLGCRGAQEGLHCIKEALDIPRLSAFTMQSLPKGCHGMEGLSRMD